MNWDDLRYLLAIHRGGTLSAAAQRLGIDQTTVSRRLQAMEKAFGATLFVRGGGRLLASDVGDMMARRAERVEAEMIGLDAELNTAAGAPAGCVRLTAVPIVANRLLLPHLAGLLASYPGLSLEIAAEPRNLSLDKRDTDIALRLARPEKGAMLCRRLGSISYSVYRATSLAESGTAPPWLDYEDRFAHLPQARWLRRQGALRARLRVGDAETLMAAVRAGHGQAVLPDFAARRQADLEVVGAAPVLSRDVWLLVHPDLRHLPRIAAVLDWLQGLFAGRKDANEREIA